MLLWPFSWQIIVGRATKAATIRVIAQKEGILRALLACQAQNRTTAPSKSGDGGHTLSLTHNAVRDKDPEVRKESLDDELGEHLFFEVNCTVATG
jgi:hypothetical protein